MKKLSLIAAALTSALVISLAGVSVSADTSEQYVTVEDGITVVHITTYVEADSVIKEQVVIWYDANGTKYINTYEQRPQEQNPVISSTVTWKDSAGNTYVRDEKTQTVTVYDVDGNVITVLPANK